MNEQKVRRKEKETRKDTPDMRAQYCNNTCYRAHWKEHKPEHNRLFKLLPSIGETKEEPTEDNKKTTDENKSKKTRNQVTIKLVQPAAGNTQQQETNVIASIRGDGTLALAYAAGNLVQNMTLNPGQNPVFY